MKTILLTESEEKVLKRMIRASLEAVAQNRSMLNGGEQLLNLIKDLARNETGMSSALSAKVLEAEQSHDEAKNRIDFDYENLLSISGKLSISVDSTN